MTTKKNPPDKAPWEGEGEGHCCPKHLEKAKDIVVLCLGSFISPKSDLESRMNKLQVEVYKFLFVDKNLWGKFCDIQPLVWFAFVCLVTIQFDWDHHNNKKNTQRNKIESLKTSQNINFIYNDEEFSLWPNYIGENFGQITWDKLWQFLTCIESAHVKSDRCVCDGHIFQMEEPLFWRAITFTLLNKIKLFKNLIIFLKMNYKLFF